MADNKMMREVESKYAWIVLAGSAIVNFLTIGFCFGTVGVFTSEYNNVFGIDTASSSWVGSILTGTILLSGPLSAYLVEKFGVRRLAVAATVLHVIGLISSAFATRIWHVIATFSLLSGLSSGLCHIATMQILGAYFDKHKHVAFASTGVACDLAAVSFPFISRAILERLKYKYALIALTAILIPAVPSAMLFAAPKAKSTCSQKTDSPVEKTKLSDSDNDLDNLSENPEQRELLLEEEITTDLSPDDAARATKPVTAPKLITDHLSIFRKPVVACFLIDQFLEGIGAAVIAVLAYTFYIERGHSDKIASFGMSAYGFGSLVGSIALTALSARLHFNRLYLHMFCSFCMTVCLFSFPFAYTHALMTLTVTMFGVVFGTQCANLGSLIAHLNGDYLLSVVYGYQMFSGGLGSLVGPVASAYLQKHFGLESGFYFSGSLCCCGLVMMGLCNIIMNRASRSEENMTSLSPDDNEVCGI